MESLKIWCAMTKICYFHTRKKKQKPQNFYFITFYFLEFYFQTMKTCQMKALLDNFNMFLGDAKINVTFKDLLGEVVVDESGLQSQVSWGVEAAAFILRRLSGGLTNG